MSNYKVQKAVRTLRMADNDYKPAKYWVYEVKLGSNVVKRFVSDTDARMWIKSEKLGVKIQTKEVFRNGRPTLILPTVKGLI
jgi:hypothetical protein